MISNPADREKIRKGLQEISDSKTRQAAETALIKDIIVDLHEQFKDHLTKKQIRKMANVFHKRSFNEEVAAHEEFETLYETVIGNKE
jgi:uncharacterized protein YpuA (DUF1002 family)